MCSHDEATYTLSGNLWTYGCFCGLVGLGKSAEEAHVNFIFARRKRGEEISERDWTRLSYSPFGFAAKCHHP